MPFCFTRQLLIYPLLGYFESSLTSIVTIIPVITRCHTPFYVLVLPWGDFENMRGVHADCCCVLRRDGLKYKYLQEQTPNLVYSSFLSFFLNLFQIIFHCYPLKENKRNFHLESLLLGFITFPSSFLWKYLQSSVVILFRYVQLGKSRRERKLSLRAIYQVVQ